MTEFSLQQAEKKIQKIQSISGRLDYWKNIIDKHFNEPLTKEFGEYESTFEQERAKKKRLVKLFGTNYKLVSPLLIPEHIYKEHFENALNEPEFTYWFLQHNARTYFDAEIRMKLLPEKLKTPLSENFIKAELKQLNDFEQKAETLLHESNLDIYKDYSYSVYAKEIEYLRIKAGYYETHALPNVHTIGLDTVVLYAEHIYLKEYLEEALNKVLPLQPITNRLEPEEIPKTFEELFYNTDFVKPYINVLREIDPPVIDSDYNYIGKLKGTFCVWIEELARQGIIKHYSDRKIFASLIPQKIKRFSIDESMFGKYNKTAEDRYRLPIKTLISRIRSSQNSQKGKPGK